MMDVGRHPRIKLFTYSEVENISGYIGNFRVKVRKKAKYVVEGECTACNDCAEVCPVVVPDEYQEGLSSRKAIYIPFPQAVPSSYILRMEDCLGNNPIACGKCLEACEKGCIDYDMQDEIVEFDVGSIIVATGMETYDPTELDEFGYTRYENVITSMELERITCSSGPTEGQLVRLTDKKQPESIGFIQCVGSRSEKRGNPYCSNICCMNTIKDTLLLKENYPELDIKVFYIDIRAFGKGFEDLYRRSREAGVKYIRGIPGDIVEDPKTKDLILRVENMITDEIEEHRLDMVVLSIGVITSKATKQIQRQLSLSSTADGFLLEAHPKLNPVNAPTRGIFYAGAAEFPKDVKDSVTQAGAAASKANTVLNSPTIRVEAITSIIDPEKCNYCGICATVCPYQAILAPDKKEKIPPKVIEASCSGCGACAAECPVDAIDMRHFTNKQIRAQIDAILEDKPEEKVIVFACNWCSYPGADLAGTSRVQYPPTARIIRTMCSGRVDEEFILYAFKQGAPIVLVSGCHFTDCHYINAVTRTQKRIDRLWNKMERMGIRPERLQVEWISAAEDRKFARVIKEMEELRQKVTRAEIKETIRILSK
jgi:heterodisulfide reductase subunit A